jgi:hypothetical protein
MELLRLAVEVLRVVQHLAVEMEEIHLHSLVALLLERLAVVILLVAEVQDFLLLALQTLEQLAEQAVQAAAAAAVVQAAVALVAVVVFLFTTNS